MSDGYVPPFQVTEEITNLTIEIGQYAGFSGHRRIYGK